jgi:hypothetical protein
MDMSSSAANDEQPETWELINDELRHRLDVQRSAFDRLETRAAFVFAAAFAALQFVARADVESDWLPAAIATYAVSMLCAGAIAAIPRRHDEMSPAAIVKGLWWHTRGRAAAELANNRRVAFEKNVSRQKWLTLALCVSVGLLALGAILSGVHLSQGRPESMSDETSEDAAPSVPQAPSPPPAEPPEPGVPTMNLLHTEIRALTGSELEHKVIVRGSEPGGEE